MKILDITSHVASSNFNLIKSLISQRNTCVGVQMKYIIYPVF